VAVCKQTIGHFNKPDIVEAFSGELNRYWQSNCAASVGNALRPERAQAHNGSRKTICPVYCPVTRHPSVRDLSEK
jgi:hypothetical protein